MKKNDDSESFGPAELPLLGRMIVVTRARAQSAEFTSQLESLGATVLHCPTIGVIPPADWAPLDAAIDQVGAYDWIVFTSANGVEFFFRRLNERRVETRALEARICAIGPATAAALSAAGVPVEVVALESRGEGVVEAIVNHLGGAELVRSLSFLIPRAKVSRDALPDALRSMGASVDAVETYQTIKPDIDRDTVVRLFKENSIDAITFTSSSTISNLAAIAGLDDLSTLLEGIVIACIGPVTAGTAEKYGLRNVVQADVYTTPALVELLTRTLGPR